VNPADTGLKRDWIQSISGTETRLLRDSHIRFVGFQSGKPVRFKKIFLAPTSVELAWAVIFHPPISEQAGTRGSKLLAQIF
jgi:hypothetical protein